MGEVGSKPKKSFSDNPKRSSLLLREKKTNVLFQLSLLFQYLKELPGKRPEKSIPQYIKYPRFYSTQSTYLAIAKNDA
jgi:hypothetical protein